MLSLKVALSCCTFFLLVTEVTKVRRNLFNQVAVSPLKKSKMPRSQSVSAVEGLKKRKRSHMDDDGKFISDSERLFTVVCKFKP